MEVANVLTQYLEQVNGDYGHLKYLLSSNAVVDWFGRSIRGSGKIFDFYRCEVCNKYEHVEFQKAEECSAIEFKPTHIKTKNIQQKSGEDGENPKKCNTTGITSLKLYASSDDDDDEIVECITVEADGDDDDNDDNGRLLVGDGISIEKVDDSIIEKLSRPSTSTIKIEIKGDDSDDSDDEASFEFVAKRAKLMPATKRTPKTTCVTKNKSDLTAYLEGMNDNEVNNDEATYSSLQYLETFGKFKLRQNEHSTSRFNEQKNERDVRLRISYRKRIADQQIKIALIIYEDAEPKPTIRSRRNLFAEFAAITNDDDEDVDDDDSDLDNGHPAIIINSADQRVIATVEATTTDEIAAALESAEFCIAPLRTPTKALKTSRSTPKRKPRTMRQLTSVKRSAARSLRL